VSNPWPQLRVGGGVRPADVVTHSDERVLESGVRIQLDADDVVRLFDDGDNFVAKFPADRIVALREPGPDAVRWTVLLADDSAMSR
jgi:hypothetical protein